MWCRSICSRLIVLGSTLLAACSLAGSAAYAQQRDEAWVIARSCLASSMTCARSS